MKNIETLKLSDIMKVNGGHDVHKCTIEVSEDKKEVKITCEPHKHEHSTVI